MSHAHHFLSRLDRLTRAHVDLALTLYRDDDLLRAVLQRARVPEGAERVALSLDHPDEGPFLIITREGRFVTCLGRGMRASNLPVVSRVELDATTAKHETWQARMAVRRRLLGSEADPSFLLNRLFDAGPYFAREEFQALATFQPIMAYEFLSDMLLTTEQYHKLLLALAPSLKKRPDKLRGPQLDALESYWKMFWATGHFAALAVADGGEYLEAQPLPRRIGHYGVAIGVATLRSGVSAQTARGAWAVARMGAALLPHYARQYASATSAREVLEAGVALLAIGAGDAKLHAEAERALQPPALAEPTLAAWAAHVSGYALHCLGDLEGISERHRRLGAKLVFERRDFIPAAVGYRFEREDDVPEDLATAFMLNLPIEFYYDGRYIKSALELAAVAARRAAEQLYLPRRFIEFVSPPWSPELALEMLKGFIENLHTPAPRQEGPTRNGPCPCGSGKKYKRCCAEVEA